jgi:aspartyl aminopeptidase
MERISGFYQMSRKDFIKMKSSSFCLSIDVAQGFHPNYPAKFDTHFTPVLGKGITLKYSAGQKYTNSAYSCAALQKLCHKKKLPLQKYVARNDNPSGSTVGPLMSATLSMRTLDIGVPLLAMHATREVISAKDQESMMKVLTAALESKDLFFHE